MTDKTSFIEAYDGNVHEFTEMEEIVRAYESLARRQEILEKYLGENSG